MRHELTGRLGLRKHANSTMAYNADPQASVQRYNSMAPIYNQAWFRGDVEDEAILNDLLQLPPAGSRLSILDVGSGAGRFLATARSRTSGALVGIDNSEGMLTEAYEHLQRVHGPDHGVKLFKADLTQLPAAQNARNGPYMKATPGGEGFDIIICMHTLSNFRGTEGPILQALSGLLKPGGGGRMVFDLERSPVVFSGIDRGLVSILGGPPTWTAIETFATEKFVDEAISQARQLVQQHMPGSAVRIARDASRMSERMSRLRDPPYGSSHKSLTIPGQTSSGESWSWTDAIHVRLANDMDPLGNIVPAGLRLSPAAYEARMTMLPEGTVNQHVPVMDLSRQEYEAVRQAQGGDLAAGSTAPPKMTMMKQEARSVKAIVVTERTG